ncbi:NAD(P)H-dependent FMN reductase [Amaricoccus macauensis]|uniref:NAD(P)H-dependent FMN reductase n=1 Tax=Amaricoccus macauensis TaxID=57001 RepID=A0A840SQ13_9RHOB|nr:NAD(P)H-dependent oxidoreductase [Amaricoccus macauensis]MBB5221936.1 NAD(P)H-dependent FMN reductase [Amaricoccus macauensis]
MPPENRPDESRSSDRLKLTLIYGSARDTRFGDIIGAWLAERLTCHPEFAVEVIDPRDLDISIRHKSDTPAGRQVRAALGAADGFIVLTPEYNRSYPAALKAVLDLAYVEWQAKPVAFVSYGGVSGGLRAVEQLRLVFAELHAVSVRDGVSFANVWDHLGEDGKLKAPPAADAALRTMVEKLAWWAGALKAARAAQPYAKAG